MKQSKVELPVWAGSLIILVCNLFGALLISLFPGISSTGGLIVLLGFYSVRAAMRLKEKGDLNLSVDYTKE